MSIIRKIKDYYKNSSGANILFTTPSHGQGRFIPEELKNLLGQKFYNCDFSEIEGFDNLSNPQGIIDNLLNKLSKIYNSKKTFILTNGSTSGILAAFLALLSEDDSVLIARNSHISACKSLVLTGSVPEWILPEYNAEWDLYEEVNAKQIEQKLSANKKIKAVYITSPTYEGVYSDINSISKVCKKHGVYLIVDEAHGALLNFGNFKTTPAILCGADISVQSLHKTAGAPNPCALLHISKSSEILPDKIQNALNLINTTSPSYPLMCAIEGTVDYLHSLEGKKEIENLLTNISKFKQSLNKNISCYDGFSDPAKLLIKINNISGLRASDILNNKFNIEEEFSNNQAMLFITGLGTNCEMLKRLSDALNFISDTETEDYFADSNTSYIMPEISLKPRTAYQKANILNKKYTVNALEAVGKISAETICAYPPGIPIIVRGEIINKQTISLAKKYLDKSTFEILT